MSTLSLAGSSLASVTATGSVTWLPCPSAFTVSVCVSHRGIGRHVEAKLQATLASVAGIAAATGWPPPSSVAVQPLGTPVTDSWYRSGAEPVVLQAQRNGRRRAGPHRDRRIIGHQVEALDVVRRLGGVRRRGDQAEEKARRRECSHAALLQKGQARSGQDHKCFAGCRRFAQTANMARRTNSSLIVTKL